MSDQIIKAVNAEHIHIQSIKVINGTINVDPNADPSAIKFYNIYFETETGINIEGNIARIIFKVELIGVNDQDQPIDVKAQYTIDFTFRIDNLENFINKGEGNTVLLLDNNLGITLMSIVYSTARGIILTRTQGTIMDNIILPVIDPHVLLTSEVTPF